MLRLTRADYVTMPWKNGGGTTTELLIRPVGAKLGERFLFRVSLADVASSGPFSAFPGCERHLMLVAGAGMTLDFTARRVEVRPFEPVAFSGDDPATGALHAGAVRDFNLIVDRARARGSLEARALDAPARVTCERGETCILHLLHGDLDVAPIGLSEGDTLVLDAPVDVTPRRGNARLVVARVRTIP